MLNKNTIITLGELSKVISNDDFMAVITYLDIKRENTTIESSQVVKKTKDEPFVPPKGVWGVFDGGAKPGDIYGSFYISEGEAKETFKFTHDHMTHNVAEYLALIKMLEYIIANNIKSPTIYGDSTLVVNQVNGKWQVKSNHLIPLRNKAANLLNKIGKHKLEWKRRNLALKYLGH